MIGNDIVDLAEAKLKSNWQRPRFLEKLFTQKEQQYIKNSDNAFVMVWRLWSMKEAAYKLYTQIYPSRFYNPKGFQCDIENLKVRYKDFQCFIQTEITSKYIIAEARLNDCKMTSKVLFFNHNKTEEQSKFLKLKLKDIASKAHNISTLKLNFYKSEFGIPTLNFNSKTIYLSLAHHGNYGVYAIS